jgi:hypothetical protein
VGGEDELPAIDDVMSENRRLRAEIEKRAAELAIVNSVQQALAADSDMRGIYEAVGDKIREIFHGTDVEIRVHDTNHRPDRDPLLLRRRRTDLDRGVPTSGLLGPPSGHGRDDRHQSGHVAGGHQVRQRGVAGHAGPEVGRLRTARMGRSVRGVVAINDFAREHAFRDSDVRLLQTLAGALSAALQNARQFEETQRLFKESEQRAAELAIVNSVQQALAAELNMQGIYDAVGDKIRGIFHGTDLNIRVFDPRTGLVQVPYIYEEGERLVIDPQPVGGMFRHLMNTGSTLLIDENLETQGHRVELAENGRVALEMLRAQSFDLICSTSKCPRWTASRCSRNSRPTRNCATYR